MPLGVFETLVPGQALGGLVPGAAMAVLARSAPRPSWIVIPREAQLLSWLRGLSFFDPRPVRPFPANDNLPFAGGSPHPDLARQRFAALADPQALRVVPACALLSTVPKDWRPKELHPGLDLPPAQLQRWLREQGYLASQELDGPATVCVRGGVTELWPVEAPAPLRIEWFDDEIERIRSFNPETGRPGPKLDRVLLLPAREASLDTEAVERAAAMLHRVGQERGFVSAHRRTILQDLRDGIWFPGIEEFLPALTPVGPVPLEHPVFVVEPDEVAAELRRFEAEVSRRWQELPERLRPEIRPEERYLNADAVLNRLRSATRVSLMLEAGARGFNTRNVGALHVRDADLAPVVTQLRRALSERIAVTVVCESETRAGRIEALLANHQLHPRRGRAGPGELCIEIGGLLTGYQDSEHVFVTAGEMFAERLAESGTSVSQFRRAASSQAARLRRGDPVVHKKHGIGRFSGLVRLPLGETEADFAQVTYRDGERLYVPVHRLDLLTPYRQEGSGELRLDRLGGSTWNQRRARVRDAVLEQAHQLLRIHARHRVPRASAWEPPGEMFALFEQAFPFVETLDQDAAIRDVLGDLEEQVPMDRLIVGDVGFGKTEVAMRAAFRAVEAGFQVVVLCPTTVLAWQHLQTFRRRFGGFPVRVELLSRAASASANLLKELAAGKVDVLITTTRVLGRQTRFARLGLVVVDEEHRFGVKQKEDLKTFADGVHYLAMSATPIPRSLQQALSGVRSLSIIATPPPGRKAIRTELARPTRERVRDDIRAELERGGQVFFVHNRVQSIEGIARWVQKLVPEARVAFAHGRMGTDVLEDVFLKFTRGEIDVLVATTIIESGLDLPLVNTMIINRADQLGLAQLYQLRGRVGRGDVPARCTLLVPEGATGGAEQHAGWERLRALQEHSELGGGFVLASQDLEHRGAGDFLGERQHGHIAAIGLDAYLELLEEAVTQARGDVARQQIDPEIEVPVSAFIPETWLPDVHERLEVYRRLAAVRTRTELSGLLDRLAEAHGALPEPVENLRWMQMARLGCRELGIEAANWLKLRVLLRFHPTTPVDPAGLLQLCADEPGRFRMVDGSTVELRFTPEEGKYPLRFLDIVWGRLRPLVPPAATTTTRRRS